MSLGHQRIKCRRNTADNFNRLSIGCTNVTDRRQTDRQTTDGRTMTYSEHKHEFTFAENHNNQGKMHKLHFKTHQLALDKKKECTA